MTHRPFIPAALITLIVTVRSFAGDAIPADICVYGGSSGGVVAAVQAARLGKRVVLVEPGRHLGGMMAGGLSWSDVGSAERAKLFGGLAREVFERIGKHYGQDPAKVFDVVAPETAGRSRSGVDFIRPPSLAFEPKVAERVFNELARAAGVKVLLDSRARAVVKEPAHTRRVDRGPVSNFGAKDNSGSERNNQPLAARIIRVELEDGGAVAAKMFIDATYEGDLMALAGVSHTVGRESNSQYGETINGVRGPQHGPPSGRFSVKVDPFVKAGDPSSGLLPLIAGGAPEPLGSADKHIQSYNYRLCLTDDPANRVPLDPPANYEPAHWELLGRYIVAMTQSGAKLTLRSFCKYDPLPNRKYDFNNRWPISTDLLGGADGWPEGTAEERARIARAHEDYLRGFFHFLRTDPRVPANVCEETARFGLPKDEFTDNGHWPHQLYVREARRMVSDFVMTENHIRNRLVAPDGIALATYPMDIHAVRRVFQDGKLYNEGFGGGGGKPAPIGYGAIVPKAAECENLFVTFALSASHAAFGSIRMEPVFMVTSQSAATAACLAIDANASVQDADRARLRARLLADGQILAAAPSASARRKVVTPDSLPGIVLDDNEAEYQGSWSVSNAQPSPIGDRYRHDNNTDRGKKSATFTATIPAAGDYEIRLLYSWHDNRSTRTKVSIAGAREEKTIRINQREGAMKDRVPNALGVFRFEAGAKARITVSNEGADGYVVVDGLQILPVETAREERAGKRPSGYPEFETAAKPVPTAAAPAPSAAHRRAAVIERPRIFIRHGERRRRFIGPHAIELPNGDLLMSAPWGRPPADIAEEIVSKHPVPDLYRSTDRGRTWTNAGRLPVAWKHRGFVSDGGVSFLRLADGRLALLLHRHVQGFKGGGLPAICFSSDDGRTWTDPVLLADPADDGAWYVMNNRLVQTLAGRLLVPVARAVGNFEGDRDESLIFYSHDAGKTWQRSEPAPLPDGPRGMAEPCVIELNDGRLLMLARGGLGVLLASHSSDGGRTWTRGARTTLTSPLSSFTLRRLPDGRLIVFYNHAAPSKPGGAFPRCPLAYAVSADEGATWSTPFIIDDEGLKPVPGELPDMAHVYPGITFLKEGMLVLYSSHMTRNRFGGRSGDVPWTPEQLARTGGKLTLLAYPPVVSGGKSSGTENGAASTTPRRVPLKVQPVRSSSAAEVRGKTYDVVVIGATPGGIACAVRAAREGLTALLVQHNQHIGGMLTGGLMQWDALYGGPRSPIFNEYAKKIENYYRETYGPDSPQFQQARYTQQHYPMSRFECGVAEHLFNQLVSAEPNITTLLAHYPAGLKREDAALKTLTLREYGTTNDITVTGITYVDATYEGDLAALAKVPYRVGREGHDEHGEPHAGKIFTNISKESGPQDAKDGKLNLHLYGHSQGTIDPDSPRTADRAVQAYNYRFCLSNEPGNIRLPEKPPGYNREEYVGYYRLFMGAGKLNARASFNSAILPGENHGYPEATWPEREKIIERHKNFALGLMWFLQNDASVRPASRERYRRIGLPLDEFPDNDNIPYEMYVREARRIVGRHVFTEHDNRPAPGLTRTPIHADSIAFTDWAMDSHDCTWDRSPGYAFDGKLILTEESRPAQIPWRSLLPQGVDNLIVPVCLSATHVAWGAVRLEPVWMMTGEAAGFAAALAKKHGTTPGQLDPDLLLLALCEKRHFASFFNDLEAAAEHPAMPAAQYFATKGFFPNYDAKLDEPLTEAVQAAWQVGLQQMRYGTLEPMRLAERVHRAESQTSPATSQKRGDFLLAQFSRLPQPR